MDAIARLLRNRSGCGSMAWWRSEQVWLILAALVLPFGWVLVLVPPDRLRAARELVRSRDSMRR